MANKTVALDIVSDVMCPWCYIGKRRLETAMADIKDVDLKITWRPYLLDPSIPATGMDRQEYLNRKFGPEQAKKNYARIKGVGDDEDIPFDFDAIKKSPSTINAHRLIMWANAQGVEDKVVEALFAAYFTQGIDIGEIDVLVEIAEKAGLEPDEIRENLSQDKDTDIVIKEIAQAQAMGITGVPGFIFDNMYLVSGAQSPEIIAETIQKAANTSPEEKRETAWER